MNKLLDLIGEQKLIQDFNELGSAIKIAEKYSITPITVYSAFKIIKFDCIVKKRVSNILTKEVLEEAYGRLGTIKATGRELGVSYEAVKIYMNKFGLDYKKQVIHNSNHDIFKEENEKSFYLAGFIAADGCVKIHTQGNSFQLSIGLSKNDKPHLEKIKNLLEAESPIRDYLVNNSNREKQWNDTWKSELAITSKIMFDDLKKFNIIPKKSLIYTFPEWLKNHKLVHHFIRGYNDGDGSFFVPQLPENRHAEQIYFSLRGTPEFLLEVRHIFEKQCELKVRETPIRISSGHGCLEYGGNGVLGKIVNYLYKDATIYLDRKYEIIKGLLNAKNNMSI